MLQARHHSGSDTELFQTQSNEQRSQTDVRGHLTADADTYASIATRIHGQLNQPYDRRVSRLVKSCDPVIQTVHGKRVLGEVIGS